jgi:hypothetical protein
VPIFLSSRPNWLPPSPASARECCSSPLGLRGETHSQGGEGVGDPIPTKLQTLWYSRCTIIPLRSPAIIVLLQSPSANVVFDYFLFLFFADGTPVPVLRQSQPSSQAWTWSASFQVGFRIFKGTVWPDWISLRVVSLERP